MHAFRRRGYGGVSIPELEAATGISAGSMYNSYGDKQGIFLASFSHYLSTVLGQRIARHATSAKGLSGLRQLFLSLLDEPNGESLGCLITNTAIEFGADAAVQAKAVQKGFDALEQLFAADLRLQDPTRARRHRRPRCVCWPSIRARSCSSEAATTTRRFAGRLILSST